MNNETKDNIESLIWTVAIIVFLGWGLGVFDTLGCK